jgi:hypothetical protein
VESYLIYRFRKGTAFSGCGKALIEAGLWEGREFRGRGKTANACSTNVCSAVEERRFSAA